MFWWGGMWRGLRDDFVWVGGVVAQVFGEDPVASCKGERVYDVQLGDPEGGAVASSSEVSQGSGDVGVGRGAGVVASGGAETSGIRTLGGRGALSYAAAAAAVASGRENGGRGGGRERRSVGAGAAANAPARLVFSLGGKALNRMLTIFQAIQRQAVAEEDEDERYAGSEGGRGGRAEAVGRGVHDHVREGGGGRGGGGGVREPGGGGGRWRGRGSRRRWWTARWRGSCRATWTGRTARTTFWCCCGCWRG